MVGWRARIGVIVPSTNTTVEYEFAKMAPEGVSIHAARMYNPETNDPKLKADALIKMGENAKEAAKELSSIKPALIAFCCTSGSFVKGKGHDKEIVKEIEEVSGVPAITTTTAVVEALKAFGKKRIVMATPYNQEIADKEEIFLENEISGLKIAHTKNLGIVSALEKGNLFPSSAYQAVKEITDEKTELAFISCTAWRTIEVLSLLETDLGIPVISSNQATFWACLKRINIRGSSEYGSLFER